MVRETGAQDLAATRLNRSKGWVTHRMNLLRLASPVQAAVAAGEIPLREARQMHTLSEDEQLAVLQELLTGSRSEPAPTAARAAAPAETHPATDVDTAAEARPESPIPLQAPRVRATRYAAAIKRLGQTPPKIADALVGELPKDAIVELVSELQTRLAQK